VISLSLPEGVDDPTDNADDESKKDVSDEGERDGNGIGNAVELEYFNIEKFSKPQTSQGYGDSEHQEDDGHEDEIVDERDGQMEGLAHEKIVKDDVDLE